METQSQKVSFTSGNILKTMLLFAGPFMLGIIVQNLYGAVDLFVVGHFATTEDVSAVTIGSQVMSMVTQLIVGFATGITVMIGQYFGAKDEKELARTTGTSILVFTIFAIILMGLLLIFHKYIVRAMNTPSEAVSATVGYLLVCSFGIIFIVAYNVISCIMMGMGDSKTPFLFIVIACIINIILDVILVKYVHLGALGAGIATTIAQAGSVLFSLIYLRKKGFGFPFHRSDIRYHKDMLKKILKVGTPVGIQNALVNTSFLFITAIINQMGVIASASVGVVEKLIVFLMIPAISCGAAVASISAQNLGAKEYARAKKCMWYGILLSIIPSLLVSVFCQWNGSLLTGLFTNNTDVILTAETYLRSYIIDCIMVSFVFSINGYLNSSGYSWFAMLHSLITTFALRIPLSWFFSKLEHTSLYIIGWAAPISTFASLLLCFIFFLWLNKKTKISSS